MENFEWRKRDLIKSIFAGQNVTYRVRILDTKDHEPIDLYLYGVRFRLFKDYFPKSSTVTIQQDPIIEKRTESLGGEPGEIVITDYDNGEVEINICGQDTSELGPCTHYYAITAEGLMPNLVNVSNPCIMMSPIVRGQIFVIDNEKYAYAINLLRNFIQDYDELNTIIESETGEEFTDADLHIAIDMAIDDFNNINPPLNTRFLLDNFPSKRLLMVGSTVHLAYKSGLLQTRNNLSYATQGGVSINDYNKTPHYSNWLTGLINEWFTRSSAIKRQMNLNLCYSSISSEYLTIDWRETRIVDSTFIEEIDFS